MTFKSIVIAVAVLVVGYMGYRQFLSPSAQIEAGDTAPKLVTKPLGQQNSQSAPPPAQAPKGMETALDDDPVGELRLEGLVLDVSDDPVAGAVVYLDSNPPKVTTSGEDGSFYFGALVQRRYQVHARSADGIGGPMTVTLTESSEPVIVQIKATGSVHITVVDSDGEAIEGATVAFPELSKVEQETDSLGLAKLKNLPTRPIVIVASAKGFSREHVLVQVPRSPAEVSHQRIVLRGAVGISGRVVDFRGKPVADAKVAVQSATSLFGSAGLGSEVATNAKGEFLIAAAPTGDSVHVRASHPLHGPASSDPIAVGDAAIVGVEIVLPEGGTVSGYVVDQNGQPVAWTTIRVNGANIGSLSRQLLADGEGKFEVQGLPREKLSVYGIGEVATSSGVEVDLRERKQIERIRIVLDVAGTIAGMVVDEHGEGVGDVQVQAIPDFWGGGDLEQLRVRGPVFATTLSDGTFTVRGLPESQYSLRAQRGAGTVGLGFPKGTSAKTGSKNVRLVLATPGTVIGTVQMTDGGAVGIATVSLSNGNSVTVVKGRFVLADVEPGIYELSVRGPLLEGTHVPNVKVTAGKTLDLGAVVVTRGRSISGRVVDASGQGVAGADIAFGRQLISDSKNFIPNELGTALDVSQGIRRTQSDDNGNYVLAGLGPQAGIVVADHVDFGRSKGTPLAKGSTNSSLTLVLDGVGSVRGVVTVNEEPQSGVQVLLNAQNGDAHIVVVTSDDKGRFFAQRVAVGPQKVTAMMQSAGAMAMASTTVAVVEGEEVLAKVNLAEGNVQFSVAIAGKDGVNIDASQVFLFKGTVDITTGGQVNAVALGASSAPKMKFAVAGAKAVFEKLVPGVKSVCVIPINGDMNDPAFLQKLQRNTDDLAVYCSQVTVTESAEQEYKAVVPAMTPLPN